MVDHKNLATIYNCNFGRCSQLSEEIQFGMPCHHGAQLSTFFFPRQEGKTLRERARAKKKQYNRRGSLFRGAGVASFAAGRLEVSAVAIPIIPWYMIGFIIVLLVIIA